jgi:DNA polymerase I-like protein with 3'-5' exonuclease and polymerase domains
MDREEAKILTLKQVNSSALTEYENLEFFQKIAKYKEDLWNKFIHDGYVETPISAYRFDKDQLQDMNPGKLLNYVLQATETALNVKLMWEIFRILRGKETKLVLCVYDSFLFDWKKNEKSVMREVLEVFKKYKLSVKIKKGISYDFN